MSFGLSYFHSSLNSLIAWTIYPPVHADSSICAQLTCVNLFLNKHLC